MTFAVCQVPATNQLRLALSLPLRNAPELTNWLAAVCRPGGRHYHHYLTPAEFAARFGPTPADYAAVLRFAQTNGLKVIGTHSNRLVIDVQGTAANVEKALNVQLQWFPRPNGRGNFFAPDRNPTVDARLPLLHVSGLDDFAPLHPNSVGVRAFPRPPATPHAGSSPDGTYMGNDFRQAYFPGTTLTGQGQSVALVQFDTFDTNDIIAYGDAIGLSNNLPPITVVSLSAGNSSAHGRQEVTLDIEMVLAMAPGVTNVYVYEAANPSPWVDILSQVADDDLAAQASCSWSGGGPDPGAEQILQQMAAQGQSFFNAAGDLDAYTNVIDFPCMSPNAVQVGATTLATDTNGDYAGETVWNQGDGVGSSGGPALAVEIPPWQLGLDGGTNGVSPFWRNLPDVALAGDGIYAIFEGQDWTESGTSCAAPLWAGIAALANQQAAQMGQPPVGFLDPAIYALGRGTNYPALFHDIVDGNNTNLINATNFYAGPGYDLCSGWGTPNGTNLIYALTAPDPLGLLPQTILSTSGTVGGPLPQTNWILTLTNAGATPLDWALGPVPSWLTVSAGGGTLAASDFTNLCVALVNPQTWLADSYRTGLFFTNLDLSRVQSVLVKVEIGQSIIQNGGFETGDFSDWTLVGQTITWHQVCNVVATDADYPGLAHSGQFGAFLGQPEYAATLSQSVPTTAGQPYLVSFWLNNQISGSWQQFSASWNGTDYIDLTEPTNFDWSNFRFVALAGDTNSVLQFSAENDPNYFGLDDVTVNPVPPVAFASYSSSTNGFQLAWASLGGLNYQIQYTTDLTQGNWRTLATISAVTNVTTFTDPNNVDQQGFYRLLLLP